MPMLGTSDGISGLMRWLCPSSISGLAGSSLGVSTPKLADPSVVYGEMCPLLAILLVTWAPPWDERGKLVLVGVRTAGPPSFDVLGDYFEVKTLAA
ncbi:hypothetical protein C4D60_Mb08t17220 [Musa balbisiana]|uniref:Uncharacterized protein n=1 Tax=Musa balbisiana TaxID=52838 RepID=A0A4S8K4E3_MUSBA|nr:hypothetical protein C4D60_Mb08t17220 [Musa balbisiana]